MKLYDSGSFFDEMLDGDQPKPHYRSFHRKLSAFSQEQLEGVQPTFRKFCTLRIFQTKKVEFPYAK